MARVAREFVIITLLALLAALIPGESSAARDDTELFNRIRVLSREGRAAELHSAGNEFRRRFPRSAHLAEVCFIMAEFETAPDSAISLYRASVQNAPGSGIALRSHRNICRLLYLNSRWPDLLRSSGEALRMHGDHEDAADFMLYMAKSYIFLERYDKAEKLCDEIIRSSRRYDDISSALLLLSHINRKTTGFSRSYFSTLRDLIEGFGDSQLIPTALYLLGRSYQERGDSNRAFSAFMEVRERYPRSPEAGYAAERIDVLAPHNPSRVPFIPTDTMLRSMDRIDLRDYHPPDEGDDEGSGTIFSVSLGPVPTENRAREIARLIKDEFGPVRIVNMGRQYGIYAGRHREQRGALTMKIRLAEELGLNGRVVRVVREAGKTYIYGD